MGRLRSARFGSRFAVCRLGLVRFRSCFFAVLGLGTSVWDREGLAEVESNEQ
jgi:hypothetical protein